MDCPIELCKALVERVSISPDEAGCHALILSLLEPLGFSHTCFKRDHVSNLWIKHARHDPRHKTLALAGHSDVVPAGDASLWRSPPFIPTLDQGRLYGRGTADMKASLAAMVSAVQKLMRHHPNLPGNIVFLLTSAEEITTRDGMCYLMKQLQKQQETMHACIIGEPTSTEQLGDTIKHGRRGSLCGKLTLHGQQGHVAYPHLAQNPIHLALMPLQALATADWDQGNAFFQPTGFQISSIQAGEGANNVIPERLHVEFNFRFSSESTEDQLKAKLCETLNAFDIHYDVEWVLSGNPYLTEPGALTEALRQSIAKCQAIEPQLSTSGGTSDGRFIAPYVPEVVEFGPVNASIHKINEHIRVEDIPRLRDIYYETMLHFFSHQ